MKFKDLPSGDSPDQNKNFNRDFFQKYAAMSCSLMRLSCSLWSATSRLPVSVAVTRPSFIFPRNFHLGASNFKRRKDKEEKV